MGAVRPELERRVTMMTVPSQLIRLKEVMDLCGLSRSSIYAAMKRGDFPPSVKVGSRSSAWVKSEIEDWIRACIRASRGEAAS